MINTKPAIAGDVDGGATSIEPKKRKKGRPSLIEIKQRMIQSKNPNPNHNSNSNHDAVRRSTRRNSNTSYTNDASGYDAEIQNLGPEKKLCLVLDAPNSAVSGSVSDSGRRVKTDEVGDCLKNLKSKIMDTHDLQELSSDSGPITPLPDKKLLVNILDKLQKKDTYGVYSEPVNPDELPDYRDIIKNPMDFGTVRKKLAVGAYASLEQFEKDVILICSNAMQYNSPETIYYRQARRIQELAQTKFENLRKESIENVLEPRRARRGRPPTKNIIKQLVRPPIGCVISDFSTNSIHANGEHNFHSSNLYDLSRQVLNKSGLFEESGRHYYGLQNPESQSLNLELKGPKLDRIEDHSGSGIKDSSMINSKKFSIVHENRRLTHTQPQIYDSTCYSSVLTALSEERKQLLPVGLFIEHAYARSLASFAANLGPAGWEAAAKKIERVLPPGMKFGHGWIGSDESTK